MTSLAAIVSTILTAAFSPTRALATVQLPTNLSKGDRQEVLRIIGFGTSSKLLSNPYPIDLEVGASVEFINTEDLGRLGSRLSAPQRDVAFSRFTIGKGLYNHVDLFLHFVPYSRENEIALYGGLLRWGFYQAKYLPIAASVVAHINTSNISNQLTTRSYGADLVGGITVNNVALFVGCGPIEATGSFIGGANGITDTGNLETETVKGFHTMVGANVSVSKMFLALQVDRYTQTVFSAKLGARF